jgi:hypothetical protein
VSPALAARLTPIPGKQARYAGASGRWIDSPLYAVAGLRIGGVEVPRFEATASANLPAEPTGGGFDLMLGTPELKGFVVEIDLRDHRLCLRPDAPAWAATPHPFALMGDTVVIPVTLDRHPFEHFIFDTAAGVSTAIPFGEFCPEASCFTGPPPATGLVITCAPE